MSIIEKAPKNYSETKIYKELKKKDKEEDGLLSMIEILISNVEPMLNLIQGGPFYNYTLHNPVHSIKLIHLSGQILKSDVISSLSALELLLIIYAAYLHDIGMVLTSESREKILISREFLISYEAKPHIVTPLNNARKHLSECKNEADRIEFEKVIYQLHEVALAEYLRPIHGNQERYVEAITRIKKASGREDLFSIRGVSFEDELIKICVSHNQEVACLSQTINAYEDLFPRDLPIGGYKVNLQFIAALLRITDILDFDYERTPRILLGCIGLTSNSFPGAKISLAEWQKHLSITNIDIKDEEIVFISESRHPSVEKGIRDFCKYIEDEIRATQAIISRNKDDITKTYSINLPSAVRPQIKATGYIYQDLSFKLNESAIITLLLGDKLYTSKFAAVRELIQNSVDACLLRERYTEIGSYKPEVKLSLFIDNGDLFLEVKDNGIGMDDYVLSNYFFKIGNSYYHSQEFAQEFGDKRKNFNPTSRFGIGILSVFMIADSFEIETRRFMSPRGDRNSRKLFVEGKDGLAFIVMSKVEDYGTRIKLKIKKEFDIESFSSELLNYTRSNILRPAVDLDLKLLDLATYKITNENYYNINSLYKGNLKPIEFNIADPDKIIFGKLFFIQNIETNALILTKELQRMKIEPLFNKFTGNRLTVNGFSVLSKKLSRVFRLDIGSVACVIDVEVSAIKDISFDVARSKLDGNGQIFLRTKLKRLLKSALKENKELEALLKYRDTSKDSYVTEKVKIIDDESILERVFKEIPEEGHWPIGLHHFIANKLMLTPNTVYRAISTLIIQGRIKKTD